MRIILSVAVFAFCGVSIAGAAQRRISFEGEACSYTARFDPAKWPESRVRAALSSVYLSDGPPVGGLYDTPQSVASFDLDAYRRQCAAAIAKAERTETLGLAEMETYRTALIAAGREMCAYQVILYRAARGEASALQEFQPAAGRCARFSDALEGKTDLDAGWRISVQESCKDNVNVRQCRARAEAERAKPDGRERARLHLLGYGWNNCAIRYMTGGPSEPIREAARKKLNAVLKVRSLPCDP